MKRKKTFLIPVFILLLLSFSGCTTTQKGAGIGTLIGAGAGAIIGHQSGEAGKGALVGGAVGAAGGALIGDAMDTMFCPTCGRHYTSGTEYCIYDGTKLKPIEK